MSSIATTLLKRRARFYAAGLVVTLFFAGCKVGPPKGVTAFVVEGPTEYISAMLLYPASEENRPPLKLKYVDRNTFQTTATLASGSYRLVLRAEPGRYINTPVTIEEGKRLYQLAVMPVTAEDFSVTKERPPKLSGVLYVPEGEMPREIVTVFVSQDVNVRRTHVAEHGRFEIQPPAKGTYWIEIFGRNSKGMWKWEKGKVELLSDTNLELVPLRRLD